MILQIVTAIFKLAAMFYANSLLAKWISTFNMYVEKFADPAMKQMVEDQYNILNEQFKNEVNETPPNDSNST